MQISHWIALNRCELSSVRGYSDDAEMRRIYWAQRSLKSRACSFNFVARDLCIVSGFASPFHSVHTIPSSRCSLSRNSDRFAAHTQQQHLIFESRKLRIIGKFFPSSFQIRITIITRPDLIDTVGSVTFRSPGTSIIPLKKRKRSDRFLARISIPMNSDETWRIAAADNRGKSITWLPVCGFSREWQSSDSGDPRWRCTPRDLWRLLYITLRNAGAILGRYAVIISDGTTRNRVITEMRAHLIRSIYYR